MMRPFSHQLSYETPITWKAPVKGEADVTVEEVLIDQEKQRAMQLRDRKHTASKTVYIKRHCSGATQRPGQGPFRPCCSKLVWGLLQGLKACVGRTLDVARMSLSG